MGGVGQRWGPYTRLGLIGCRDWSFTETGQADATWAYHCKPCGGRGMQLCWLQPSGSSKEVGNGSRGSLGPGTAAQPGPKAVRCQPALTQEGNMPFMEAPRSLACACACAFSTGRRVTADAVLQLFLMAQRSPGQMEGKGKGGA